METRPVTADELPAFHRATEASFHEDVDPQRLDLERTLFEPERSLAVFDGAEIVATAAIYTRELTIPGAVMQVAGVTAVGVLPSHRRRGLLTQLMRRQLDDVRAAGEPVAALWASEPNIYGRFGYGLAARHGTIRLRTGGARLRPEAPQSDPTARVTLLDPQAAIARIAPLYDRVRRERPGHVDRQGPWWERRIFDPERWREGSSALRAAVREDASGTVGGYVLYAVKEGWNDGPDATVNVRELVAEGPEATAALWAFLLGLDLTRTIVWEIGPPDEPLAELVAGPQRARIELGHNLWVRLVDVGGALAARAYAAPVDVVLEIDDAFCPWNAGRWRLRAPGPGDAASATAAAVCERTDAAPDLALSAADLGAAYLGGTSLAALHAAGRVRELRGGTLVPTALAFRGAREPWCPEIF